METLSFNFVSKIPQNYTRQNLSNAINLKCQSIHVELLLVFSGSFSRKKNIINWKKIEFQCTFLMEKCLSFLMKWRLKCLPHLSLSVASIDEQNKLNKVLV